MDRLSLPRNEEKPFLDRPAEIEKVHVLDDENKPQSFFFHFLLEFMDSSVNLSWRCAHELTQFLLHIFLSKDDASEMNSDDIRFLFIQTTRQTDQPSGCDLAKNDDILQWKVVDNRGVEEELG